GPHDRAELGLADERAGARRVRERAGALDRVAARVAHDPEPEGEPRDERLGPLLARGERLLDAAVERSDDVERAHEERRPDPGRRIEDGVEELDAAPDLAERGVGRGVTDPGEYGGLRREGVLHGLRLELLEVSERLLGLVPREEPLREAPAPERPVGLGER